MLIPIKDKILILAMDDGDTWYGSSSIIRPESTKGRAVHGVVKAIGPEVRDVKVGDHVIFPPYGGTVINHPMEGWKMIMVKETEVKCLIFPPTTEVPLYVETENGFEPCTAEAALMIIQNVYNTLPRFVEMKEKFEQRLADIEV